MESLSVIEKPVSEKYDKLLSKLGEQVNKGTAIKSIQVWKIHQMMAFEIRVTLFDGSLTTASLPRWCYKSEHKDFITYYVNKFLAPKLIGNEVLLQKAIDKALDQLIEQISKEHSLGEMEKLARNVNWAMSVAVCKAGARCKKTSLCKYIAKLAKGLDDDFESEFYAPMPSFVIDDGGLRPKERLADQHLVILPLEACSFHEAIYILKKIYNEHFKVPAVEIDGYNAVDAGDEEGSYTPSIKDIKNSLRSLQKIIADFGYEEKVSIGVNIGASKFYRHDDKTYRLNFSAENSDGDSDRISGDVLFKVYRSLRMEFDLTTFEDPFHMDDQEHSSRLNQIALPGQHMVMEFDLVTDHETFFDMAKRCNSFLLKVDQLGSVSKCIDFAVTAQIVNWNVVMPGHDSCETSDPFIADFCVAFSLEQIKLGVSCLTSACNICNRLRELEIEKLEEDCKWFPIPIEERDKRFEGKESDFCYEAYLALCRKGAMTRMIERFK